MAIVKNVFIEVRSRLRCCNFYITTSIELTSNCNLKVNLVSDSIELDYSEFDETDDVFVKKYNGKFKIRKESVSSLDSASSLEEDSSSDDKSGWSESIDLREHFRIIPNSMSGLKIDKNSITFRVLVQSKTGEFDRELFPLKSIGSSQSRVDKRETNIPQGTQVKFLCGNCSNVVSGGDVEGYVTFDRVLELPTENFDMSDWFCHNHGGHSSDTHEFKDLTPGIEDLFFRICSIMVNTSKLSEKCNDFNKKHCVYHCNRCLNWLGVYNPQRSSVKLYNSTVKVFSSETMRVFKNCDASNSDYDFNTHDDFLYAVKSIMRDLELGHQYSLNFRLLVECQMDDRNKQCLMLWIMDRELEVLRSVDNPLELESIKLAKVLYRVKPSSDNDVQSWMTDPFVAHSDVSKNMFLCALGHLKEMSGYVPECFRESNGYSVSYLKL